MTNKYNLDNAESVFAISNTPIFLLRKLSEDTETSKISQEHTGEQLLSDLRQALDSGSGDVYSSVLPYVLLVALWKKETIEFLNRAASFESDDEWYRYCVNILLHTYKSTTSKIVPTPTLTKNLVSAYSTANTVTGKIYIP
jgi:hypothetical protein